MVGKHTKDDGALTYQARPHYCAGDKIELVYDRQVCYNPDFTDWAADRYSVATLHTPHDMSMPNSHVTAKSAISVIDDLHDLLH